MVDLVTVSTGDIITSARANLIKDYLEDGTHEINTLSLEIGGVEVIDSSRNISGNNLSGSNTGDQDLSSYAPIASPSLTGIANVTNTSAGALITQVRHLNSSNTVGTGGRLAFRMLDSNSAVQTYGRIATEIDVNTAGSEDGTMRFSVIGGGAFDDLIILDGSSKSVTFAGAVSGTNLSGSNTGDDPADNTAYNATSWDANTDSATKNAIRDKVETMDTAIGLNTDKVTNATHTGDVTGSTALTIAAKAVDVAMIADGTDGELITWGADAVATTVATGTATHVLTSNGAGTAPTFQSRTTSGAGAPGSTPTYLGAIYVDTTALKIYISTGTGSSADWKKVLSQ